MDDQARSDRAVPAAALSAAARAEIVRRYWLKGDLTPLAVANSLAGQRVPEAA